MKKTKYLLLIISISIFCLILAGCAVSAKYSTAATKNFGVADFIFDNSLIHPDDDNNNICDLCGKQSCTHSDRDAYPAVAMDCTKDEAGVGNIAYSQCKTCGLYFDEDDNQIALEDTVIPVAHNYENAQCTVCSEQIVWGGYINWVNGNSFPEGSDASTGTVDFSTGESMVRTHNTLPGNILSRDRVLTFSGWIVVEGGVSEYVYSVDGDEWKPVTTQKFMTLDNYDIYKSIFNIQSGDMSKSIFQEENAMGIDLSAYYGQTVDVRVAIRGPLTGSTYIPFLEVKDIDVRTAYVANIATIENVSDPYVATIGSLDNGIIEHNNITLEGSDGILDWTGWMMIDGGQNNLAWSPNGGLNWYDPTTVSYANGTDEHTASVISHAGVVDWSLTNATVFMGIDLSAYKGKSITVTLRRSTTDINGQPEDIVFAKLGVNVPASIDGSGAPVCDCTSNSWTVNSDGTHTGLCNKCGAIVTEACVVGDWMSDGTQHWKGCAKCGYEVSGTRGNHDTPTQTNCDETKTCPICSKVLEAAGEHKLNGQPTSNGLTASTHTLTCSELGCTYSVTTPCSGGTAYCNTHPSCDACGGAYGTIDASNHKTPNTTIYVDNGNGTHTEKYDCCKTDIQTVSHTYGDFVSNNAGSHVRTCTASGCGATDTAACTSDGEFETSDSQHWTNCSTCGYDMGKTNHNYGTTYSDNGDGTHSRTCECGKVLTENCVSNNIYVTTDATYHWTNCTNCGSTMNYEKHDLKYGGTADIHKYCATAGCGYIMTDHSEAIDTRVVTAPTCTEQGYTTNTCKCGYVYKDNYTAALGHNVQYVGTAEMHKKCTRCDDANTASHADSMTSTVTTAATCTSTGVRTYTCSCPYTYTETIPALGHTGGTATCQTQATCTRCGVKYGNYGSHDYSNSELLSSATCTSAAAYQWKCKHCSVGGGTYTSGSALGHSYARSGIQVKCSRSGCGDVIANGYFVASEIGDRLEASHHNIVPTVTKYDTAVNFQVGSDGQGIYCLNFNGATGKYVVVEYHAPCTAGGANGNMGDTQFIMQGCAGVSNGSYQQGRACPGTNDSYIVGMQQNTTVREMVINHNGYQIIQLRFMAVCDNKADADALLTWLNRSYNFTI